MLERIIYVSRARADVGARDAYDIIRTAHNRNSRLGLTGALLLIDGHFMQVLEGQSIHLERRFAAICADPRHSDIELRSRETIEEPAFAGDWMALWLDDSVSAGLRDRSGYAPGFPRDRFDGGALLAFALACCRPTADENLTAPAWSLSNRAV